MRKMLACALVVCMAFLAVPAAASEQATDLTLTLDFAFGERTGVYTGGVSGGLPDGEGSFTSRNGEGDEWTYTGGWVDGHIEGDGVTVWVSGWEEEGQYADDLLNGVGKINQICRTTIHQI